MISRRRFLQAVAVGIPALAAGALLHPSPAAATAPLLLPEGKIESFAQLKASGGIVAGNALAIVGEPGPEIIELKPRQTRHPEWDARITLTPKTMQHYHLTFEQCHNIPESEWELMNLAMLTEQSISA